jgi:hypothetical protein
MSNARDKANIPALNFSSTGIDDNATSTAITIDSSENVGIGTVSPDTILHIASGSSGASPASGTHLFLESSGDTQLCISSPNANSSQIRFGSPSDASGAIISYDDTNNKFTFGGSSANTFLTFNTGGAIVERMRIDSSGNVGIGTSSPGQKVAIAVDDNNTGIGNGTQNLELSNINGTNNTYSRILFNDTVGGAGAGIFGLKLTDTTNNYGQFEFWTRGSSGGNTRMVIDPNGNVGIGTSSSNEKMQLNSSGSTFLQLTTTTTGTANNNGLYVGVNSLGEGFVGLRDTNGNPLIFQTENTERMRIDSSGNVGIGTSSPIGTLDVRGTSNFSTSNHTVLANTTATNDITIGTGLVNGALILVTGYGNSVSGNISGMWMVGGFGGGSTTTLVTQIVNNVTNTGSMSLAFQSSGVVRLTVQNTNSTHTKFYGITVIRLKA